MATINKLSISYSSLTGGTVTHNFKYVNPSVTAANVISLINATLANKTIFQVQPQAAKSASLVQTTDTSIDISGS